MVAALAFTTHGIEFADALHLSSRPADAAFVSFDETFVRRAKRAGVFGVSGLSGGRQARPIRYPYLQPPM